MKVHHHSLLESFGFALNGIKLALKYNRSLRIHFVIAAIVILFGFLLRFNYAELAITIMIVALVLSAEMINTAIEEVVDLVTKDYREEAKVAKDVSAGMVLLVATGSIAIGLIIFIPHIYNLIINF